MKVTNLSNTEKDFIRENLYTKDGYCNTWSSKISWWHKRFPEHEYLYDKIFSTIESFTHSAHNRSISCTFYCALNDIHIQPVCNCGIPLNFHEHKFTEMCKRCSDFASAKKVSLILLNKSDEEKQAIMAKSKATKLKKYGDENFSNREKSKKTCLSRYGVDNGSKTKEAKNKISLALTGTTNINAIGELHHSFKTLSDEAKLVLFDKDNLAARLATTVGYVLAEELNVSHSLPYKYAEKYGIKIHRKSGSVQETELSNFVQSITQNMTTNDRTIITPYELDMYMQEHNLAIEFNGLYWHSTNDINEIDKYKNRHILKTNMCENLGIQLLHINCNEWGTTMSKDIWKSIIRSKLGVTENIISAEECILEKIGKKSAKEFLDHNHLQGNADNAESFGLIYNNDLVSIATFGISQYTKGEMELLRFCSKLNTKVVGSMSTLIKYRGYSSIIAFVDRRWSSGNTYKQSGWNIESVSESNCNFWIRKFGEYEFATTKTDICNMLADGYSVIWDAGNIKYRYP
ncbi:MAG: hypothetical protein R8M45_10685 [Ghiorsea sp.]